MWNILRRKAFLILSGLRLWFHLFLLDFSSLCYQAGECSHIYKAKTSVEDASPGICQRLSSCHLCCSVLLQLTGVSYQDGDGSFLTSSCSQINSSQTDSIIFNTNSVKASQSSPLRWPSEKKCALEKLMSWKSLYYAAESPCHVATRTAGWDCDSAGSSDVCVCMCVCVIGGRVCNLRFTISVVAIWGEACSHIRTQFVAPAPPKCFFSPLPTRTHTHFIIRYDYTSAKAKGKVTHMQRCRHTPLLHMAKCHSQTRIDLLKIQVEWWPCCDIHTGTGTHAGFARREGRWRWLICLWRDLILCFRYGNVKKSFSFPPASQLALCYTFSVVFSYSPCAVMRFYWRAFVSSRLDVHSNARQDAESASVHLYSS